jgi:hypothetical protein
MQNQELRFSVSICARLNFVIGASTMGTGEDLCLFAQAFEHIVQKITYASFNVNSMGSRPNKACRTCRQTNNARSRANARGPVLNVL